ncbi:ABC transporter permease [Paenibacillus kobensis]|uniref:ABC transporter permease n=1 Tax=Paenibacillus kobensis TaxID=59841 RepID=UPI000FD7C974|nr:ABC-2 family transporter protein [Paenibacillus kobensis]
MERFSKHSAADYVSLYFKFVKMIMMSRMMYKWDTFLLSFSVLVRESVTVITLVLMLNKFSVIDGWNMSSLLFLYSFVFLSYSLSILMFTGLRDFEEAVHQGVFDGYLTKPLSPLFHVISKKSDVMATFGHGGLGIILFVYSFNKIGLDWSLKSILVVLWMLAGGILVQGAILLFCAAITFWTTKSNEIQNILFYQTRGFIAYPISIYPKVIKVILTMVIPLAFVNYYPASYMIKHETVWLLSPVVGLVAFALSYAVWRRGMLHYKSTGH